jgi:outer membrane protein OmpA-like peptidoglycan-associated protein
MTHFQRDLVVYGVFVVISCLCLLFLASCSSQQITEEPLLGKDFYEGELQRVEKDNSMLVRKLEELEGEYEQARGEWEMDKLIEAKVPPKMSIWFLLDDIELSRDSVKTLDYIAFCMHRMPFLYLEIAGHCCTLGSDQYNRRLSIERIKKAALYLVEEKGISKGRITTTPYGESEACGPCAIERRCDLILYGD